MLIGDARLRLQEVPSQSYALLVVDAFSGDSIPTHLLITAYVWNDHDVSDEDASVDTIGIWTDEQFDLLSVFRW
jgi:hypothetical protein